MGEQASLTVCLEYHDDITPPEYQPKGYEHSDYIPQVQFEDDKLAEALGMGQVDMMHYKMALRLRSKAKVLTPEDDIHPSQLESNQVEHNEEASSEDHSMEVETAQMTAKEIK